MGDLITMLQILNNLGNEGIIDGSVIEEVAENLDKKLEKILGTVAYALLFNSINSQEECQDIPQNS